MTRAEQAYDLAKEAQAHHAHAGKAPKAEALYAEVNLRGGLPLLELWSGSGLTPGTGRGCEAAELRSGCLRLRPERY